MIATSATCCSAASPPCMPIGSRPWLGALQTSATSRPTPDDDLSVPCPPPPPPIAPATLHDFCERHHTRKLSLFGSARKPVRADDDTHRVHYVRRPFWREPDFGVTRVTYPLAELLAPAEGPR